MTDNVPEKTVSLEEVLALGEDPREVEEVGDVDDLYTPGIDSALLWFMQDLTEQLGDHFLEKIIRKSSHDCKRLQGYLLSCLDCAKELNKVNMRDLEDSNGEETPEYGLYCQILNKWKKATIDAFVDVRSSHVEHRRHYMTA